MVHTQSWMPNPFAKRLEGTTNPTLGLNLYAADRQKPVFKNPVLDESSTKTASQ